MNAATSTEAQLLTRALFAARLNISVRQLDRLISTEKFPKPIRVGPRSPRWREADVQTYLASLIN